MYVIGKGRYDKLLRRRTRFALLGALFVVATFISCLGAWWPQSAQAMPDELEYSYTQGMPATGINSYVSPLSSTVDADDNLYIIGTFSGTIDFDTGTGVDTFSSPDVQPDLFATKINADGSYGWTWVATGTGDNGFVEHIAVDAAGNVYVGGVFSGTVEFDSEGAGEEVTSLTGSDGFVVKLNTNGSFGWLRVVSTLTSSDNVVGLVVDDDDNLYMAGLFGGTFDFDADGSGDTVNPAPYTSGDYLTKINADGSYGWTEVIGLNDGNGSVAGLGMDAAGGLYMSGKFTSSADFDFRGAGDTRTPAASAMFITKYNPDGSYAWTTIAGGSATGNIEFGNATITDPQNGVLVAGTFSDVQDFNPDGGGDVRTGPVGQNQIFITKINLDGSYGWTWTTDGANTDVTPTWQQLAFNEDGDVYLKGFFHLTLDFDPGSPAGEHDSGSSNTAVFIVKLDGATGDYEWSRLHGLSSGGSSFQEPYDLQASHDGGVYLVGQFTGQIDFDPDGAGDLRDAGSTWYGFMLGVSPDGDYEGLYRPDDGGIGNQFGAGYLAAAIDSENSVYLIGYQTGGTDDFNPEGTPDLLTADGSDGRITKLVLGAATTSPDASNDKNGDNVIDAGQPNVEVVTENGGTIVLEVDDNCEIISSAMVSEASLTPQDAGYDYPKGLMNFTIECDTPGMTSPVKQFYYGLNPSGLVTRKFNPNTPAYFNIAGATVSQVTIYGQQVTLAAYSATDGGMLDTDGTANTFIVDPAGLGELVVGAPNTGLGGRR